MKEINNKLDGINELITRIDAKVLEISTKLDAVIAAIHEYDDDQLEWSEPNDALKEAAFQYNELVANKRMDIIGQNGNEGIHYVTNEEADDDVRSNNPANDVGEKKHNNSRPLVEGKNKSQHKGNTGKTQAPPPPKPKRKSAIEEHIKYPLHKH